MNLNFYYAAVEKLEKAKWLPPLVARLTLAGVFIESGWGKIHNIEKVTEYFVSLKIPAAAFQAPFVAWNELIVGILMLLGLATRFASAPLIIMMTVAITTAKIEDIHEFTDVFSFSEFLFIVLALYLLITGPGAVSLDHWVRKKTRK